MTVLEVALWLSILLTEFAKGHPVAVIRIEERFSENGTVALKDLVIDALRNSLRLVSEAGLKELSEEEFEELGRNYLVIIIGNETRFQPKDRQKLSFSDEEEYVNDSSPSLNQDVRDWQHRASIRKEEIKQRGGSYIQIGIAACILIFCVVHILVVIAFRRFLRRKTKRRHFKFQKIFLDSTYSLQTPAVTSVTPGITGLA